MINVLSQRRLALVALISILTTFTGELLQTFIIPCATLLPSIDNYFYAEFSYGVYFIGAICGLIAGFSLINILKFRRSYLFGIGVSCIVSLVAMFVTTYSYKVDHNVFHYYMILYGFRIISGFGVSLTYGLNSALIVRYFRNEVQFSCWRLKFKYSSNQIFAWCYMVLLLEVTLNPAIAYRLFDNCSPLTSSKYLTLINVIWFTLCFFILPADENQQDTKAKNGNYLTTMLKNQRFILSALALGVTTGVVIIMNTALPLLIEKYFTKASSSYELVNGMLVLSSALGAFISSLLKNNKLLLLSKKIIFILVICTIFALLIPSKYVFIVSYFMLISVVTGFLLPIFNNVSMLSIETRYQTVASVTLNIFILVALFLFNLIGAKINIHIFALKLVICLAMVFVLLVISKIGRSIQA